MNSDPSTNAGGAGASSQGGPLLAAVFTALPELVLVLDRDGNYVDVLGGRDDTRYHDGRTLVGKTLYDVLPEDRADEFLERIRAALETGEVVHHEYSLSVHDVEGVESRPGVDDDLWFEGRAAPVVTDAEHDDLVVWVAFNVTESKRAARRLHQQKQELEQQRTELMTMSEEKQRLLAAVSHDLRKPLTAIRGFLELLDARWTDLDPEQARDLLQRGAANADRMEQMLTELLDASLREHAELAVEPRELDVADVLRAVVDAFDGAEHGVRVDTAEGRVHADPAHLERIIVNLLDNACKYGAPPIELSGVQDGPHVHLRVQDHGPGVDPEFVPELFSAFTQGQGASSTGEDGIGLGLSIVRQLAQRNDGTVTYEHNDTGACFTVTLPVAGPPRPAPSSP